MSGLALMLMQHRRSAQLTQEELAERSGLSVRAIRALETGKVMTPRSATVHLLAQALDLDEGDRSALHVAARGDDPALPDGRPSTVWRQPAELPMDVSDFSGRDVDVRWVSDSLRTSFGADGGVPVTAITGCAGVGKTSLAVHVAHLLYANFSDGQLWVDLRGIEQRPIDPADVLGRFLRGLGVSPSAVPDDPDERGALFRSLLRERRVLVVLDNAASADQVRPLLPGAPGAAVLVTSRRRLAGLVGAAQIDLEELAPAAAMQFLRRALGDGRVLDELPAAEGIARACGYLPLALRIVAARLATHPHWSLSRLLHALLDERQVLDQLRLDDFEVRASVGLSYAGLDGEARRAFRLVSSLAADDVAGWVVGPLLGISAQDAEVVVDRLVDARLIDVVVGATPAVEARYGMHDLVRAFGRERALAEETTRQRDDALVRTAGAWLALADRAAEKVPNRWMWGGEGRHEATRVDLGAEFTEWLLADPTAWFEREYVAILAVIEQCAERSRVQERRLARELAMASAGFLRLRGYNTESLPAFRSLLAAADRAQCRRTQAVAHCLLGDISMDLDRYEVARDHYGCAVDTFQALDAPTEMAYVLARVSFVLRLLGRTREAVDAAEAGVRVLTAQPIGASARRGLHDVLWSRASAYLELGRLAEARADLNEALGLARRRGDDVSAAQCHYKLGLSWLRSDHPQRAERDLQTGLRISRESCDELGVAYIYSALSEVHAACQQFAAGRQALDYADAIFIRVHLRRGTATALHARGSLEAAAGNMTAARNCFDAAIAVWRRLGFIGETHRTAIARALIADAS